MQPEAVIFDLFGTLLDISSLEAAAAPYFDDPAAFVATWREKQIGYAFAATIMDRYEDFDALTARALQYAASRHGPPGKPGWETLAARWREVAPYPDAAPALAQLRRRQLTCGVLTNGTAATAATALQSAGLAGMIDVVLTVDAARAYKPDPRVYALATGHFATTAERLLFVTSNGWDATGASESGFAVAWCNRRDAPRETFGTAPGWTIRNLHELAQIVV